MNIWAIRLLLCVFTIWGERSHIVLVSSVVAYLFLSRRPGKGLKHTTGHGSVASMPMVENA